MKKILALICIMTLTVSLFAGCGSDDAEKTEEAGKTDSNEETIKIGTIQPITGDIAAYGTQTRDAIQMAVEEINENGGVLGKEIELVVEDDEGKPEKTINAFKKLVSKDKIVGFVGALTSNCSLAINTEAQNEKIPMITPASTNDTVTDAGDYVFRACYSDSFQGNVVAKFAYEDLGVTKAAILFDVTNDYSVGLKDEFTTTFEELGGEVVAVESYSSGDVDFKAQLTSISTTEPDVLFLPDYYSTVALIAQQVRNAGIDAPMLGADGWDSIVGQGADEVAGSYYSNHYSAEVEDEQVQSFVTKFEETYNVAPNALAALGYDAMYIMAKAIEEAGSTDSEVIKDALANVTYKGVTGEISFDENGDTIKSAVMEEIVLEDGVLTTKYAGTVNP